MDQHEPVLLDEAIDALSIQPDGIYIDATFGRGGHSKKILEKLNENGKLYALDRDVDAVKFAQEKFHHDKRFCISQTSFSHLAEIAQEKNIAQKVNGILLDLGVSSPQLDDPQRGFSFSQDGPLDMRMDTRRGKTAAAWINSAKEKEIVDVLFTFGEEKFARRMANAIVKERSIQSIETTGRLAEIIKAANPAWEKNKHPATRAFQAIRIFINEELKEIESVLHQALGILASHGRLVVISFHSLEDRIVKRFMRDFSRDQTIPQGVPVRASELKPRLKTIGRAIKASETEVRKNPRSRSAVLRVAEIT